MPGAYKATHSQTWQNPQKLNLQSIRLRHNLFDADLDSTQTYPRFKTSLLLNSTTRVYFRDTAISVYSSADGQLDIDADTEVEITAPTVQLTGAFSLGSVNTETLAGNKTLTATDAPVQFLDPGGAARTVTLPAEASSTGLVYLIANRADLAEDLTVQDDGAATVVTISQNECGIIFCDGVTWEGFVGANT